MSVQHDVIAGQIKDQLTAIGRISSDLHNISKGFSNVEDTDAALRFLNRSLFLAIERLNSLNEQLAELDRVPWYASVLKFVTLAK